MKKKKKVFQGALSTIILMTFVVMFLSFLLSLFGLEGYETYISNGRLESSLITVNNIFSVKNTDDRQSKIITVLGYKHKIARKKTIA